MKNINKYLYAAIAGLALVGCNDLDTSPMGSVITEEDRADVITKDPSKLEATVTGIFGNFYAYAVNVSSNSDFGLAASHLILESRSQDFISQNPSAYGWFEAPVRFLDNTPTSSYDLQLWGVMYKTIFSANQVVAICDEDGDDTERFYLAQALGARAYAYWYLAQIYQFNYVGHEQSPCVPLITEKNSDEVAVNGTPRATVEEIYTQIIDDLNTAERCLTDNTLQRTDKRYMDIDVIRAVRARTYLCMQKYAEAANDAQAVINGSAQPISVAQASIPGFNVATASNWLWGIVMTENDVHGLYTFAGFMGSFSYGYAFVGMWKTIASDLFDRIPSNDVRKGWWIDPESGNSVADNYSATYAGMTAREYLLYGVEAPGYAVTKFATYQDKLYQSTNASDVPIIRIEEMYLILAEAQAMGGNLTEGKQTLENFVNTYRWLDSANPYVCSATTADEILDEVWFQRRVELWGEGIAYMDCLRLNKGINRTGAVNCDETFKWNIPAGSAVLLYQIPQSEIEGNPALTTADQNPTGSATL